MIFELQYFSDICIVLIPAFASEIHLHWEPYKIVVEILYKCFILPTFWAASLSHSDCEFWGKHSFFSQENIIYIRTSLRNAHVNLCLHLCRALILASTPILILSLSVMSLSTLVDMGSLERAILFHLALTICFCSYVIGLGPIPNVLCSEMFPTKARAICVSFCSLSFWFGGLLSAYCFPVMLSTIGLGGACGIYALMCCIALCLIYYRIPEMTAFNLEFIAELFQNSRQSRYI